MDEAREKLSIAKENLKEAREWVDMAVAKEGCCGIPSKALIKAILTVAIPDKTILKKAISVLELQRDQALIDCQTHLPDE